MQDHQFSFEVNASVEDVWAVFWGRKTGDVVEHGNVRIEILHGGDANGEGLVRHCHFPVPWYLLSGGKAKSWEWLTQVKKHESWRYDAVGKPLWSQATGWTRLEALADGRTRVHFRETYRVFNPVLRFLLEKRVHRAISKDNDQKMKMGVEMALKARARAGQGRKDCGVTPDITLHEAMFTLRAMRRLKSDPIPLDDLRYIIEAATMASSPGNSQPWRFIVVTDAQQKSRIADIYREIGNVAIREGALRHGKLDAEMEQVYRHALVLVDNLQHAPALVMCCVTGSPGDEGIQQSTFYGAIYPAIQNLMLAARSKGIGATLTTLHKAREQDIKQVLQIPEDVTTVALIPLGYPQGKWGRPKRRPPADVTYWNVWPQA